MAYGRLDVFYPDGNFRSFPLKDEQVSVGRSPGNTITLDTETISRYHFSIINESGDIHLADMESQNGTYIDGIKIPQGEKLPLRGGEEIIVGDLRIIYHEMDESPTQPVRTGEGTTQRIEKQDVPFSLSVQPPPIAIPPGAHASAELTITNTSEEKGFYTVEVAGIDRNWVRIDRPKLMLDPQEAAQAIINVRPVRRSDTVPGEYEIRLVVREENTPNARLEAKTYIRVLPYSGFGAALERKRITATERFRLHLHNQGNADLPLVIGGGDRTPQTELELVSSSQVILQPGQRLVIQGKAKLKKTKLIGTAETQPFDVVVRSEDPSQFMAVLRGQVSQQPMLPTWSLGVGAGVLAAFVLLLLFIVAALTAPNPQITAFSVSSTQVARGEPLQIEWAAEDVAEIALLVDGTPVATFPPQTSSYTLQTTALPRSAVVEVAGSARNREARLSQTVRIYDPVLMRTFTANPPELVRFVVQPLTLSWELDNAAFVQVNGLEAFTTDEGLAPEYRAVDETDELVGIPLDDLSVSVYAEDDLGNPFTYQELIPAVLPQCTAADADVPLRNGPDPRNQQVATVFADDTVVVDARDITGAWVRVQLDAGLSGWGALDAFTCTDRFNPANLRQVVEVTPPPPPPITPTAAPADTTETGGVTRTPGSVVPTTTPTAQPTTAG